MINRKMRNNVIIVKLLSASEITITWRHRKALIIISIIITNIVAQVISMPQCNSYITLLWFVNDAVEMYGVIDVRTVFDAQIAGDKPMYCFFVMP